MLDNVVGVAGVVYREARTPFGIANHRRPELWVVRQAGIIGRPGQQRDETHALFTGYVQSPMLGDHVLVAAQGFGVGRRTAHNLAPPRHDVAAMLITHLAAEQWGHQVIVLDEVIEPTQPALEGRPPACPVVDRRDLAVHATPTEHYFGRL